MSATTPKGPYTLMTVNTAPERAFKLIGRMIEALKDQYTIQHMANVTEIGQVEGKVKELQPDVVFSASMWNPEQAKEIAEIARANKAGVKTFAIPQGMQVEKGPDYVVQYLVEQVPGLLDQ